MLISELVSKLQEIKKSCGDVHIAYVNHDTNIHQEPDEGMIDLHSVRFEPGFVVWEENTDPLRKKYENFKPIIRPTVVLS